MDLIENELFHSLRLLNQGQWQEKTRGPPLAVHGTAGPGR